MRLRWYVVSLLLGVLLPMLALTLGLVYRNAQVHRQAVQEGMAQVVGNMALALDRELNVTAAVLNALAATVQTPGEVDRLRASAEGIRGQHPGWAMLFVTRESGRHRLAIAPADRTVIGGEPSDALPELANGVRTAVSNLYWSPVLAQHATSVHVPLAGPGLSTLAVAIPSAHWGAFLRGRSIPEGWVAAIIDRNGTVVARTRGAERFVGKPATAWQREGIRKAPSGQLAGPALEGEPISLVYRRSEASGWTVTFAAPTSVFQEPMRRALHMALLVSLAVGAAVLLAALLVARRIVRPIADLLAASSRSLERLERLPHLPATPVTEINELYAALAKASEEMAAAASARSRAGEARHAVEMAEQAERQGHLRESAQASDAANRAKSTFLATMSHEIRTPMNGVLGMLELLSMTRLDAEQRSTLEVARQSSRSLLRIIDDILDFSKIEAGKLELRPRAVSVPEIVARVRNMYSGNASSKGLSLSLRVDERISPAVVADPLRLQQILANLVSNAIKFTHAGTIELAAELESRSESVDVVRFRVADTGIGMSPEQQEKLFNPFYQAEPDGAQAYGGTGLGLSICRRLAGMMGGELAARSERGAGTTMILTLPLPRASPDELERTSPAPVMPVPRARAGADTAGEAAVLVVDDHPVNRMLLLKQVQALGYAALSAEDGREALELWRSRPFAAILTDCNMPHMDGFELARRIRQEESERGEDRRIPIIACTANALRGDAERCLAAGMDDYLAKPVELAQLAPKLDAWTLPERATDPLPAADSSAAEPVFDPAVLAQVCEGDPVLVARIRGEFDKTSREDVQSLAEAARRGDLEAAAASAHRLKGAAGTTGARALASACAQVEAAARGGRAEEVQALLALVVFELDRAHQELAKLAGRPGEGADAQG